MLIGDFAEKVDELIIIVEEKSKGEVKQLAQQEANPIDKSESPVSEYVILPYFKQQEQCYIGEQYDEQDNICALPVTCTTVDDCIEWGDQLIRELETKYGGFQDFYGFIDYDYYDEEDASDEYLYEEDYIAEDDLFEEEEQFSFLNNYDEEIVATYLINNNELNIPDEDDDWSYYAEWFWDEFTWVIPSEELWMLESFSVFNDDELIAYVIQEQDDLKKWNLAINLNTNISYHDSISTHVHEFAHLLFLNSLQVNPYKSSIACYSGVYIEDKGCPYSRSYIVEFIDRFGLDYEQEYETDIYVSEYAASNILEDMAETFYMFVLTEKPEGNTIAEQKILLFYEYEELVFLRAKILSRVATLMYRVIYAE